MASGILFIAILIFATRGYFLSLPGVIARLIGLLCAYFVAFGFRAELASMLATKSHSDMHPMLLQAVSGAVLFFGTLFFVSLTILGLFKLTTRLIPALRPVLSREALGSRIGGATLNGAVGAVLVLAGLWVYGFTLGKNTEPDGLQQFANQFGDRAFALTRQLLESDRDESRRQTVAASRTIARGTQAGAIEQDTIVTAEEEDVAELVTPIIRGTAEIRSVDNPDKHLFIERYQAVTPEPKTEVTDWLEDDTEAEESTEPNSEQSLLEQLIGATDLETLLKRKDVKDITRDPAVRKKALEILQSNPELLENAAKNPKYRGLIKQLQQADD